MTRISYESRPQQLYLTMNWPTPTEAFLSTLTLAVILGLAVSYEDEDEEHYEDEFEDDKFIRDQGHLEEHLGGLNFDWKNTNKHEVDFMFFKVHDTDNDNKLDGLEIMASLQHKHDHPGNGTKQYPVQTAAELKKVIGLVDVILEKDDLNHDGYLTYAEYATARIAGKALQKPALDKAQG